MERSFVKRDSNIKQLLVTGTLSPIVKDFVYDGGVPKPCRHFCGRDKESNCWRSSGLCLAMTAFLRL